MPKLTLLILILSSLSLQAETEEVNDYANFSLSSDPHINFPHYQTLSTSVTPKASYVRSEVH